MSKTLEGFGRLLPQCPRGWIKRRGITSTKRRLLAVLAGLVFTMPAFAEEELSIEACTTGKGQPIDSSACIAYRKVNKPVSPAQCAQSAECIQAKERRDDNLHHLACVDHSGMAIYTQDCNSLRQTNKWWMKEGECQRSAECRDQTQLRAQMSRQRREQTRLAQDEAIEHDEDARQRKVAAAAASQKARCGDDYKNPKIGMSIDRVRACVTQVKLKGQLNRADGVVSTFEGGNAYFHVMEGRIISWGKY